jgi:hypothetical protein
MWQVGDKAYCIRSCIGMTPEGPSLSPGGLPVEGSVYLVRAVHTWRDGLGLALAGFPAIHTSGIEAGWHPDNFRKLIPRSERERAHDCIAEHRSNAVGEGLN